MDEPKQELRTSPEELKELKRLFSAIRVCQINGQQADTAYQAYCLGLAIKYGVQDEQYNIDRLTGTIKIMPGMLPGVGGGPQR